MSAFAAAMEALVADPNLGTAAIYHQGGSGNGRPAWWIGAGTDDR